LGPCLLWGVLEGVGWPAIVVWCLGDIYVKRFLWGVEGVREVGNDIQELLGGVWERVGSLIVVECDEWSNVLSGDKFGGVGWGIVVSKISARRSVEKVRFASSAVNLLAWRQRPDEMVTYSSGNESHRVEFASSSSRELQVSHHHEAG